MKKGIRYGEFKHPKEMGFSGSIGRFCYGGKVMRKAEGGAVDYEKMPEADLRKPKYSADRTFAQDWADNTYVGRGAKKVLDAMRSEPAQEKYQTGGGFKKGGRVR